MRNLDSFRRPLGGNVAAAKAVGLTVALVLAACGSSDNCHFMPLAVGLIGQTTYNLGSANQGLAAATGSTVAAPLGGLVIGTLPDGTFVGYLADTGNNRVLGYMLGTNPNLLVASPAKAADFVLGQPSLTSVASGTSATNFFGPAKVSVSDAGQLVVTDTKNNRVLIWNTLPTTATSPTLVIGQTSFTTRSPGFSSSLATQPTICTTSPSSAAGDQLNNPLGAMIGSNELDVVDQNNNRVLVWNDVATLLAAQKNGAPADVVLGQDNFCGINPGYFSSITASNNSTVQKIAFNLPSDVWTNGSDLFVSDTGNNRVLYWSGIPITNNFTASYVVGQTLFTRNQEGASSQVMNGPVGVTADSSNNFYVADTANNRVLQFSGFPLTNGPIATAVFGQQDFTHSSYNDDDQNGTPGDQQNNQTNVFPTENTLQGPTGVSVTNGILYVADRNNNRVIEFEANSGVNGSQTNFCNGYSFYDSPPNPQ